jgi:hypothetical protein
LPEEAAVSDLESQLRECLTRHAETATSAPDAEAVTRTRRRRTHRRRQAAAVGAMIPLTAGVVIAATVLPGSSATRGSQTVSVGTSPTPTRVRPTPTTGRVSYLVRPCRQGSRPDVRVAGRVRHPSAAAIRSQRDYIRQDVRHFHGRIKQFAGISRTLTVDGRHASPHELFVEVELANGHHSLQLVRTHSGRPWTVYNVKLLGCVPSSGSH